MQSTAIVIMRESLEGKKQKPEALEVPRAIWYQRKLRFGFAFQHLTTTVKAVGADVVTQVDFARCRLYSRTGGGKSSMRVVHAALRRRFFVLLDSHARLLDG